MFEKTKIRQLQDSNLRGQSPTDFESVSLTTRTSCLDKSLTNTLFQSTSHSFKSQLYLIDYSINMSEKARELIARVEGDNCKEAVLSIVADDMNPSSSFDFKEVMQTMTKQVRAGCHVEK